MTVHRSKSRAFSANLADKARRMGIPVWRFSEEGGA